MRSITTVAKFNILSSKRCAAAAVNISKHVDRYSKYSPSPLSVQQFLDFGKS